MGRRLERERQRAYMAETEAANQRRRANEFQEVLQRLQGQMVSLSTDIDEVLGAWDDD